MNILIINYEYLPIGAGAARQNYYLATELVNNGHKVIQLTSSYKHFNGSTNENGVLIYRIKAIRKKQNQSNMFEMLSFVVSALFKVNKLIRKHQIERIIVFFSIPCGPVALWAKWISGIDYIVSLRGGDVPGYDIHLNTFHKLLQYPRRLIYKQSKAIIANSQSLAALARKADPYAVEVIENAVDSNLFAPTKELKSTNKFIFLFVGRLHAIKNIDLLLKWAYQTHKNRQDFEVHIYGEGPEYISIKKIIEKQQLQDVVKLFSWVSPNELSRIYNKANCFVNPSRNEGLPNTVMEAMSSGLPVIASNVVGNKDLIEHNVNGLLFENENLEDFTKQCLKMMENPQLLEKFGKRNRQIVVKKYSRKALAANYEKYL